MDKIQTLKTATNLTVGLGVGTVIGNLVGASTPPAIGILSRVLIPIGSFALGSILGDLAGKAAEDFIDSSVDAVQVVKTTFKEAKNKA